MKFKLSLDESLFDDAIDVTSTTVTDFDDDFEFDDHLTQDVLEGPAEGADTGVADVIIALINDEWEAIQGYNNAIATLRAWADENPFYTDAEKVIADISAEENRHVGQLQEILKKISPNANDIDAGAKEAKSQFNFEGGKLQVQSWDTPTNNPTVSTECNDEMTCTLTDIDDEM